MTLETELKNEMIEALAYFENVFLEKSRNDESDSSLYACAEIALRRIVSKKPIDKSQNQTDWHIMTCPTCGRTFWNSGDFVHYEPHYCENCGQAIDWCL